MALADQIIGGEEMGSGRSSGNFPVVYFPAGKENHDKAQTGNDPV